MELEEHMHLVEQQIVDMVLARGLEDGKLPSLPEEAVSELVRLNAVDAVVVEGVEAPNLSFEDILAHDVVSEEEEDNAEVVLVVDRTAKEVADLVLDNMPRWGQFEQLVDNDVVALRQLDVDELEERVDPLQLHESDADLVRTTRRELEEFDDLMIVEDIHFDLVEHKTCWSLD